MKKLLTCLMLTGLLGSVLTSVASHAQGTQSIAIVSVQNIIRVARSGGDFTNLNDAIDSIQRPSAQNPVLIDVAPGVFRLSKPVVLQEHVHLRGSGVGVTTLFGSFGGLDSSDPESVMLRSFDHSTIHELSIVNKSIGNSAVGIFHGNGSRLCALDGLSPPVTMKSISVRISGTANNKTGIKAECGRMVMRDISIEVRGGDNATGLDMDFFGDLEIENADIFVAYASNIVGAHLFNNASLVNSSIRTIGKLVGQGRNIGVIADSLESLSRTRVSVFRGTRVAGIEAGSPGGGIRIENNSIVSAGGGSTSNIGVNAIETGNLVINSSRIFGDPSVEYRSFDSFPNGFKAFGSTFTSFPQLNSAGECLFSVYTIRGGGGSFPLPEDCITVER